MTDEAKSTVFDPAKLGEDLGKWIEDLVVKGAYGHTVAEVLGLALTLEQTIDIVLVKALGREEAWAVDVLLREVLGQFGRNRKIDILREIMRRRPVGTQEPDRLIERIRNLFKIRDMIAHGGLIEPGSGGESLQVVGYRRGERQSHNLDFEQIEKVAKEASEALEELLRFSI